MKILSIDTSAAPASCALNCDGELLGESYVNVKLTHSETLLPMVEGMLRSAKCEMREVDAFAVSVGPGSFTGVRIGVAAVKGMAFAGDKPCVAVSTLEAMAQPLKFTKGLICAAMDARCNQVYNALFLSDGTAVTRLCEDRALMLDELKSELAAMTNGEYKNTPIYFVGDGAKLAFDAMGEMAGKILLPHSHRYQRASGVAAVAERKIATGETLSAASLMPSYLRLPQAQRELKAKNLKK